MGGEGLQGILASRPPLRVSTVCRRLTRIQFACHHYHNQGRWKGDVHKGVMNFSESLKTNFASRSLYLKLSLEDKIIRW
jgi:hypothetical protein